MTTLRAAGSQRTDIGMFVRQLRLAARDRV